MGAFMLGKVNNGRQIQKTYHTIVVFTQPKIQLFVSCWLIKQSTLNKVENNYVK